VRRADRRDRRHQEDLRQWEESAHDMLLSRPFSFGRRGGSPRRPI
jgi:hypothetical protein